MKITKQLDSKSSVIYITDAFNVNYICIFDRLKNSQVGHPRYKVFIVREGYQSAREYIVTQVYESLYDVAKKLIYKE